MSKFKKGDRVRRIKAHTSYPDLAPKGYEFVVNSVVGSYIKEADRTISHFADNLELVPELTLAEQLAAAKAEVDRIQAAIDEADKPRVGDKYVNASGDMWWKIEAVLDNQIAYSGPTRVMAIAHNYKTAFAACTLERAN